MPSTTCQRKPLVSKMQLHALLAKMHQLKPLPTRFSQLYTTEFCQDLCTPLLRDQDPKWRGPAQSMTTPLALNTLLSCSRLSLLQHNEMLHSYRLLAAELAAIRGRLP